MKLCEALRLSKNPRVAVVGGGGKTTVVFQLARELAGPSLVTTTTHMGVEQIEKADRHFFVLSPLDVEQALQSRPEGVVLFTRENTPEVRTTSPDAQTLQSIYQHAQQMGAPLVIEADGSRCLPLKAPAQHEPVIPAFVDTVVVVAGLSGLGKPLMEGEVHRPERFSELSGLKIGDAVTPQGLIKVLIHPDGGLKNIPAGAQRIALLNRADTPELQVTAKKMAPALLKSFDRVVISSLKNGEIFAVYEPLAGIILAGGGAKRMKAAKLLLTWKGEPFIRHVVQTAVQSGLNPVVIVTGGYAEEVAEAVADLPVKIVHNPIWESGQSSSVKAGLQALPANSGGAVFLLGDQPQVPAALVQSLVERHAQNLAPIVAPRVDGQRGNPVLWDRITFQDMLNLSGDAGGRQLFSIYAVDYVTWDDASVLLDVDTPDDYKKFKEILE